MTKAKRPGSAKNEKAPTATKPKAPFHRGDDKRRGDKRTAAYEAPKDSRRVPYSASKSPDNAANRPEQRMMARPVNKNANSQEHGVGARISRRAADRLRAGHVWVYASDVESLNAGDGIAPALLPVADSRGLLLGTALYSPASQIALRLVSRESINEAKWLKLLAERLHTAIARRKPMLTAETDACRLCFSEADELPGLIVDKYGDLLILQLLTKGLDSQAVRDVCVRVLREELDPAAIVERPDPRVA